MSKSKFNEDFFARVREMESYTVEQLEEMILNHWKDSSESVDEVVESYLSVRKRKLNATFEWTSENVEKLLNLNQKLIDCFEKLRDEALPLIKTLRRRINEKDVFLHDVNMDARVTPYILMPDEDGKLSEPENGIELILTESLNKHCDLYVWFIFDEENAAEMIYLNKEQNWNIEPHFEGKFDNHFISQAIHDLYDHTHWSFPDMLRINHLWTELQIVHQHFENV